MPTAKKTRRGEPWTLPELKQLGKAPDSLLARRSRRTIKEVVVEREYRSWDAGLRVSSNADVNSTFAPSIPAVRCRMPGRLNRARCLAPRRMPTSRDAWAAPSPQSLCGAPDWVFPIPIINSAPLPLRKSRSWENFPTRKSHARLAVRQAQSVPNGASWTAETRRSPQILDTRTGSPPEHCI